MPTYTHRSILPFPAADVFAWHARPGAFQRLNPPWDPVELVSQSGNIQDGDRLEISLRMGPFRRRWVAEHRHFIDGRQFQDVQIKGPFAEWEHTHTITPVDGFRCELRDEIRYQLPFGFLGQLCGGAFMRRMLEQLFVYRHRLTCDDLTAHSLFSKGRPMQILVTGSSGLVGSKLIPFLMTGGHAVTRLVRSNSSSDGATVTWDPPARTIDREALNGFDAVVHLGGENIAGKRWSDAQKARIRDSRVQGTRFLAETLAGLDAPTKTFLSASAIGYYGNRGEELLDETSPPGDGFLADVCKEWEAAADPAREKGIRTVHARFGVILSPEGGALKEMLFPFKMCAGGVMGSGKQYWSWVGIDDVVGAILHALSNENITGPVNVVAPNPVTNRAFTKTLGKVLARPTILPMPGFLARIVLGEMADALLLASARVLPNKLQETGYDFRFPTLEPVLRHLLGR